MISIAGRFREATAARAAFPVAIAAVCLLLSRQTLPAKPLLVEDFADPSGWTEQVQGQASIRIVPEGVQGNALRIQADGGLAYYTRDLDPARLRGRTVSVRGKVKLRDVTVGEKIFCTAKLHIAVHADGKIRHHATRFTGTADWHDQYLSVDIPENAERVVLDLGIQNGYGTAWYDQVVVDDGVREHRALSIDRMANAGIIDSHADRGKAPVIGADSLGLAGFSRMFVRLGEVDFQILPPDANFGLHGIVLRGRERPELPLTMHTMIPVDAKGSRLFFLQASAWADIEAREPCLVYDVAYADGRHERIVMREGIDIGSLRDPKSLPNWKVVWSTRQDGMHVGMGISQWLNPRPDTAIRWIRPASTGRHGVPIILAVSLDPKPLQANP